MIEVNIYLIAYCLSCYLETCNFQLVRPSIGKVVLKSIVVNKSSNIDSSLFAKGSGFGLQHI